MADRLSDIAIQRGLGNLPGWSRRGDVITKTYQFPDFMKGIDFVVAVAKAADPFVSTSQRTKEPA